MTFQNHNHDAIRYLTSDLLPEELVTHAFFSRSGGISQGPLSALNMGLTVGDDPDNVYKNRALAFNALGRRRQVYQTVGWCTALKRLFTSSHALQPKKFPPKQILS